MPTATKKAAKSKKGSKATIHMGLLLDESGSMAHNQQAVVDGVNEFVQSLVGEKNSNRTKFTLAMFDERANAPICRVKAKQVKLADWKSLTTDDYVPHGMTPLYDAVAQTISTIDSGRKSGDKCMMVIVTDGLENASKEYDRDKIKQLIQRKEKDGYTFIYLGANVDAQKEGTMLGITTPSSYNFTSSPTGTRSAMKTNSSMSRSYLASGGQLSAEQMKSYGDTIPEHSTDQPAKDDEGSVPDQSSSDQARNLLRNS